jgi:hypothetical protein
VARLGLALSTTLEYEPAWWTRLNGGTDASPESEGWLPLGKEGQGLPQQGAGLEAGPRYQGESAKGEVVSETETTRDREREGDDRDREVETPTPEPSEPDEPTPDDEPKPDDEEERQ